jgi:hypothetical protein
MPVASPRVVGTEKFVISLSLRSADVPFDRVVAALGREPHRLWRAGDQKTAPNGRLLGGIRDDFRCMIRLGSFETTIEDAITACLDALSAAAFELSAFVDSGGMARLGIGWFCTGDSGLEMPAELVTALAGLKVDLALYLYVHGRLDEPQDDLAPVSRTPG